MPIAIDYTPAGLLTQVAQNVGQYDQGLQQQQIAERQQAEQRAAQQQQFQNNQALRQQQEADAQRALQQQNLNRDFGLRQQNVQSEAEWRKQQAQLRGEQIKNQDQNHDQDLELKAQALAIKRMGAQGAEIFKDPEMSNAYTIAAHYASTISSQLRQAQEALYIAKNFTQPPPGPEITGPMEESVNRLQDQFGKAGANLSTVEKQWAERVRARTGHDPLGANFPVPGAPAPTTQPTINPSSGLPVGTRSDAGFDPNAQSIAAAQARTDTTLAKGPPTPANQPEVPAVSSPGYAFGGIPPIQAATFDINTVPADKRTKTDIHGRVHTVIGRDPASGKYIYSD